MNLVKRSHQLHESHLSQNDHLFSKSCIKAAISNKWNQIQLKIGSIILNYIADITTNLKQKQKTIQKQKHMRLIIQFFNNLAKSCT